MGDQDQEKVCLSFMNYKIRELLCTVYNCVAPCVNPIFHIALCSILVIFTIKELGFFSEFLQRNFTFNFPFFDFNSSILNKVKVINKNNVNM